jgi:hypothetical protein
MLFYPPFENKETVIWRIWVLSAKIFYKREKPGRFSRFRDLRAWFFLDSLYCCKSVGRLSLLGNDSNESTLRLVYNTH